MFTTDERLASKLNVQLETVTVEEVRHCALIVELDIDTKEEPSATREIFEGAVRLNIVAELLSYK